MNSFLKALLYGFLGLVFLGWLVGNQDDGTSSRGGRGYTATGSGGSRNSGTTDRAYYESSPALEVASWRCDKEYGYVFVRGEVRNISDEKLENIMVVGELRTSDGTMVKTADALIQYNLLMPGQSSPFKAGTTDNPEITHCNISFKHLVGSPIEATMRKTRQQEQREHIAEAQCLLNNKGYDAGAVDGVMGPRTDAAIKAFQRDRNLAVNGKVDERLLQELRR